MEGYRGEDWEGGCVGQQCGAGWESYESRRRKCGRMDGCLCTCRESLPFWSLESMVCLFCLFFSCHLSSFLLSGSRQLRLIRPLLRQHTNLFGVYLMCDAYAASLAPRQGKNAEAKQGTIINVSSAIAFVDVAFGNQPATSAYSLSKAAVTRFTEILHAG